MRKRRCLPAILAIVLLLLCATAVSAQSVNVLRNGSFEGEFVNGVGEGWTAFHNGGDASYGYGADDWVDATYDGLYSQLVEIHTLGVGGSQRDRYTGIYQTAEVVPGAVYMFSLYGLVRSSEGTEQQSNWNYRVQVGLDLDGGTDPGAVTDWRELPWPEFEIENPGSPQSYAQGITATSDRVTVFIRLWKKFPTVGQRAYLNLDAISLVGPNHAAKPASASAAALLPETGVGSVVALAGAALAALALGIHALRRSDD